MDRERIKPKYRLSDITNISGNVSRVLRELTDIKNDVNLKRTYAFALEPGYVVCVPYVCKCDIQCDCDQYCNYCDCVDYGKCKDHDPCPEYIPCSCDYDCRLVCSCDGDWG